MSYDPNSFEEVLSAARACRICEADLPLGPRPVVRASRSARLLIVGQAPGTRVHASGIPWDDRSGERLREWLNLSPDIFSDEAKIAIVPMGFCFPGNDERGGDLPPPAICAKTWHAPIRQHLSGVSLTLLIGLYAQRFYLGKARKSSLTETVAAFRDYLPDYLPLPHPSWRNTGWLKKNPWFAADLLPELRARISSALEA